MTTIAAPPRASAATGESRPDPLAQARALAPTLSERSQEIERVRTLPPDVVDLLRQAGLFRMAMPARLGGGVAPRTIIEVIEEVSRADAATGWSLLVGNMGAAFLAWLSPETAGQIVAGDPDLVIAGAQAPLGQAVRDGSVYRLSGRWPFASGCRHASWLTGGFIVMVDGAPQLDPTGMPEMRVGYFPADRAQVVDTWHVAGLAGTGSDDIVVEDIEVPAEHTSVPYFEPANGHSDPLFRLTGYNVLAALLGGFPLGVARRALDEVTAQLTDRHGADGESRLRDPAVQLSLLRHETALRAARRHLLDTLEELLATLPDHSRHEYARRARLAAAMFHTYDVGREAVQDCFRLGGTGALFEDNPLQRCLRDLVAGGQHIAFAADSRKRVATALLGLQRAPVFFGV